MILIFKKSSMEWVFDLLCLIYLNCFRILLTQNWQRVNTIVSLYYHKLLLTVLDSGRVKLMWGNLSWPPSWNGSTLWSQILWLNFQALCQIIKKKLGRFLLRLFYSAHVVPGPYRQRESKILFLREFLPLGSWTPL